MLCGPFTVPLLTDKLLYGDLGSFKWGYSLLLSCNGTRTVLTFITGDFMSCRLLTEREAGDLTLAIGCVIERNLSSGTLQSIEDVLLWLSEN